MTEYGFFWNSAYGTPTLRDVFYSRQAFINHPEYHKDVTELVDMRHSDISAMNRQSINHIVDFTQQETTDVQNRSVLVVNTQLEFGLSRMLDANLTQSSPVERAVFYNIKEALEWLCPGQADAVLKLYEARHQQLYASSPSN